MNTLKTVIDDALVAYWAENAQSPYRINANPEDAVEFLRSLFDENEEAATEVEAHFPEAAAMARRASRRLVGAGIESWVNPCNGLTVPFVTDPRIARGTVVLEDQP